MVFSLLKTYISTGGVIGGTANRYGESCVYINCRHLPGRLDLCVVSTNFRVVSLFTFGVETREMLTFCLVRPMCVPAAPFVRSTNTTAATSFSSLGKELR